ncbi:hypothetical protein F5B18DRAFT_278498 [Nemania serpens]|nr:hypothetical protein F5B18DRAFT_278498 [Nemania serpens]
MGQEWDHLYPYSDLIFSITIGIRYGGVQILQIATDIMPPGLVPTIPKIYQVIPGALVNIVLKADQRTGRQVQGTVQNVLTKGDHPRGIKVRLTDGRIGRVQSMTTGVENDSSTQPPFTDSHSPSPYTLPASEEARESRGQGRRSRYHDVRLEEPLDVPPEQIDLSAYIVPSKRKGRGEKRSSASQANEVADSGDGLNRRATTEVISAVASAVASAVVTCPVCGTFEGDETSVAHHVAEHFGS